MKANSFNQTDLRPKETKQALKRNNRGNSAVKKVTIWVCLWRASPKFHVREIKKPGSKQGRGQR